MSLKLVWVNHEQLEHEREMCAWREWILREGRCFACEAPHAEYENESGWPLCANCALPETENATG